MDGNRPIDRVRRSIIAKFISLILISILVVGNIALVKLCFFPKRELTRRVQMEKKLQQPSNVWEKILTSTEGIKEELRFRHFHNVDKTLMVEQRAPSLCFRCHGNYPHSKSKEIRALLNMHTFFAACEVCHVRSKNGEKLEFFWFDNETGKIVTQIKPSDGNYGAKIVPVVKTKEGLKRLDNPVTDEYAKQFMQAWAKYNLDQRSLAKHELHKDLARKPVQCNECHRHKNPYLNFAELGYSKSWVTELTGTEVVGMVDKYMKFYIPTMFNPQEIRKQRQEILRRRGR